MAEGRQALNRPFQTHIDLCLNCRACEAVCPSGVHYGLLLESARAEIVTRTIRSPFERFVRWLVFGQLFPFPARLEALTRLTALYQRLGLQRVVRATGILSHLGRLGEMESLLPARPLRPFRKTRALKTAVSSAPVRGRAALFTGCILRAGFAQTHDATLRVLETNGWRVEVPREQICCAALHVHAGEQARAQEMARRNIEAFEHGGWDVILVNAAGCGANLKEYDRLLADDARYADRAAAFVRRVRDVSQVLADTPLQPPGRISRRVTFQEPCHLAHAQRIKEQPRSILKQIPGLELIEMEASDRCCGSAGIYNLLHPDMANALLEEKIANARGTGADTIVTGNIGCQLQVDMGVRRAGLNMRVMHWIELLDEAYSSAALN